MKLLFDQNLSHKLVGHLDDVFPDSEHVRNVGLREAADHVIWEFAKSKGFAIVSKDDDFHQTSFLHGPPPKVIWVKLGNCSTEDVERVLRKNFENLLHFGNDKEAAFTIISSEVRYG